jgi:glycosyltransferase involved in cell wall biosynthesis
MIEKARRVSVMLSVVIATRDNARSLATTLAMLVPGAMRGIVREVIVADGGSTDATVEIADATGCNVLVSMAPLGGRLAAAAGTARARWLMFLRPGTLLEMTWLDEIVPFIEEAEADGGARTAAFHGLGADAGGYPGMKAVSSLLRLRSFARPHPDQGLVISVSRYKALRGHRPGAADPERDLLARIGRRHIVVLHSIARR